MNSLRLTDFVDNAIRIYSNVRSYAEANYIGQTVLLPMAEHFSPVQIKRVLKTIQDNSEIYEARETPRIIE